MLLYIADSGIEELNAECWEHVFKIVLQLIAWKLQRNIEDLIN